MVVKLSEVTFRPLFFKVSFLSLTHISVTRSIEETNIITLYLFSCLIGLRQRMLPRTGC